MRRPSSAGLSAEDRSPAQRWAIARTSLYWTIAIVIIVALLASSRTDKVTVAGQSGRKDLLQDRSGMRPNDWFLTMVQAMPACTASQPCDRAQGGTLRKQSAAN
jgi:hypothetical protein